MSAPKAPYGPHDISAPLTPEQRATIIRWLPGAWAWMTANGWSGLQLPSNFASLPDDQLITLYGGAYVGTNFSPGGITLNPIQAIQSAGITNPTTGQNFQNPLTSVEQFLTMLANPNLWIRVGEFSVGAILLAIAFSAILKPGNALSKFPAVRAVRTLA